MLRMVYSLNQAVVQQPAAIQQSAVVMRQRLELAESMRQCLEQAERSLRNIQSPSIFPAVPSRLEDLGKNIVLLKGMVQRAVTAFTPQMHDQLKGMTSKVATQICDLYILVQQGENRATVDFFTKKIAELERSLADEETPIFNLFSAFQRLADTAPRSLQLFCFSSFLDAKDIPYSIFQREGQIFLEMEQLLEPLRKEKLLSQHSGEKFSIQLLAQEMVRKVFSPEEKIPCLDALYSLFEGAWTFDQADRSTWKDSKHLVPHLIALINSTPQDPHVLQKKAQYLTQLGLYFSTVEVDLDQSLSYHEQALALNNLIFGKNHPDVAIGLCDLGKIKQTKGDFLGAKACYEIALQFYINQNEEQYPNETAAVFNCLGALLTEMLPSTDNLRTAEEYHQKAHDLYYISRDTVTNTDMAKTLTYLGNVRLKQGKLEEAKNQYIKALLIYKDCSGPDAAHFIEQLLDDDCTETDEENPVQVDERLLEDELTELEILDLADLTSNLGDVLSRQRNFEQAKKCYEEALNLVSAYGPHDPRLIKILIHLGSVCNSLREYGDALDHYTAARRISYLANGDKEAMFFNHLIASIGAGNQE